MPWVKRYLPQGVIFILYTSSFGSLISATGGTGSSTNSSQKAGGMGSGGTVNYQGGDAQGNYSGGGGVACIFGRGMPGSYSGGNYPTGSGGYGRPGGAGGGFGKNGGFYTSDGKGTTYGTFGIIMTGAEGRQQSPEASVFYISPAAIPNCIDMLGTGPGGVQDGGKGYGINGGGGAAHNGSNPGAGGWPGGGGGSGGSAASPYGNGADGCVIVEY